MNRLIAQVLFAYFDERVSRELRLANKAARKQWLLENRGRRASR